MIQLELFNIPYEEKKVVPFIEDLNMWTTKVVNPQHPLPIGTKIWWKFEITGYTHDCDGSYMATVAHLNEDDEQTGWTSKCHGLYGTYLESENNEE